MSETQPSTLVFGRNGQLAGAFAKIGYAPICFLDRARVDLTDPEACGAAVRESDVEIVIDAAAYTNVDAAENDAGTVRTMNAIECLKVEFRRRIGRKSLRSEDVAGEFRPLSIHTIHTWLGLCLQKGACTDVRAAAGYRGLSCLFLCFSCGMSRT